MSNLSTTEFIKSFKRLVLRKGNPNIICSDNTKTFISGVKWLSSIKRDDNFHDFLSKEIIILKFKPFKGTIVRRTIQTFSRAYKVKSIQSNGKSFLTCSELEVNF